MGPGEEKSRDVWWTRRREIVTTFASGFVGALALAMSIYNVYLQRQQVRAAVWPRLALAFNLGEAGLNVVIANRGVGPAEVKRVRVAVDGKPMKDWIDAVTTILHASHLSYFPKISSIEGAVISPGSDETTLTIQNDADAVGFMAGRRRISMDLCYCSSLGDCFDLSQDGLSPQRTTAADGCPPDAHPFESVTEKTMDGLMNEMTESLKADAGAPDARAADAGAAR